MIRRCFDYRLTVYATMLAVLMATNPSDASIVGALTLEELVQNSSLIIHGRVMRIRSQFDANYRTIYSQIDIAPAPDGILFDDPQRNATLRRLGNVITLKLLGGIADVPTPEGEVRKKMLVVVGNPSFQRNEEILLFARPGTKEFTGFFRLFGMAQGKWGIKNGIAKRDTGGARIIGVQPEELDDLPVFALRIWIRQEIQRQAVERQRR